MGWEPSVGLFPRQWGRSCEGPPVIREMQYGGCSNCEMVLLLHSIRMSLVSELTWMLTALRAVWARYHCRRQELGNGIPYSSLFEISLASPHLCGFRLLKSKMIVLVINWNHITWSTLWEILPQADSSGCLYSYWLLYLRCPHLFILLSKYFNAQ